MPTPSSPLATSLAVLAALLDGWATQPELAERVWQAPTDAQRRLVSRHLMALRRARAPIETRSREGNVTRAATEYRATLRDAVRWMRSMRRDSTG